MTELLWNIETPTEELDRLERELIEMELANGFDFHAPVNHTPEELRERAIADFNAPELTFDSPECLEFMAGLDTAEERWAELEKNATETKH